MNTLITGANRGIGLELTKLYAKDGHVYTLVRKSSDELNALENVTVIENVDVTDLKSIHEAQKQMKGIKFDLLINNAGYLSTQSLDNLNYSEMLKQFQINTLGPLKVVETFLDQLNNGSKLAVLTSRMGSLADNTSGGQYGYRMSKAAANMMCVSLAHDLADREIAVAILHPGYVRTGMTNFNGLIDPPESAEGLYKVMQGVNLSNSGKFWHSNGEQLPF
jgi:NAD(P)-dependent dehydrogenase (short-subunit alcohol dehydrogenase family)